MSTKSLLPSAGLAAIFSLVGGIAFSEPGGIEGSWSGGGTVTFATGSTERATCRATYHRAGNGYSMNGVCATPSGRAAQTAALRRVAANRFEGNFHNAEYNISGRISVVVNGNQQNVRLSSDSASANIHLRR